MSYKSLLFLAPIGYAGYIAGRKFANYFGQSKANDRADAVEAASKDSFPASDAPSWINE